jgi:hypothetical protein
MILRRDRFTGSPEAISHARAYLDTVQAIDDPLAVPSALFQLGFALLWSGEHTDAERHISRALQLAERSGYHSLEGRCLTYLTIIVRQHGDAEQVQVFYNPAQPLFIDPTLTWNTFLGGSDSDDSNAIVVDASGNVYVAGRSFATWGTPVTAHAGAVDAFAAQLTSSGSMCC